MPLSGDEQAQNLFNRGEDGFTHTIQNYMTKLPYYMTKLPLLKDGANTGGTTTIYTGTAGTKLGTLLLAIVEGWGYNLHALNFNANQNGTFGTNEIPSIKMNGINLGTLGPASNFATLFGEDLTLYGTQEIVSKVNCGTGVDGTYTTIVSCPGGNLKSLISKRDDGFDR